MQNSQEKLLNETGSYLQNQEDYIVPVKKIWQALHPSEITLEQFINIVKNDSRFYFQEANDVVTSAHLTKEQIEKEEQLMEQMGYFAGPRVMLKSKAPSANEVFHSIAVQLKIMQDALERAYLARPENDLEAGKKLSHALQKSKDLENKLIDTFRKVKPKD